MTMCRETGERVCDFDEIGCEFDNVLSTNLTLSEWVKNAASEVLRRVAAKNDGNCPKTLSEWRECCTKYDISTHELRRSSTFTALLIGTRGGAWWIFYNDCAPQNRQNRYIAHELAEYITREESWHIDPPPGSESFSEFQVHHLIATEFEQLACYD